MHPDSFYARPAQFKVNWMAARCPMGRLLEVGCGEPSFLLAAREHGFEIAALEAHADRAARVSERLGIPVEQAFLEQDTLPAGTFDVVYHCDMLAHFPDPLGALASMMRLLKPEGVLCFEVGVLGGISTFWYRQIKELALGPHLFLYSYKSLDMLIEQAGLEVLHRTRFGLAPEVLSLIPRAGLTKLARTLVSQERAQTLQEWTYNAVRYSAGRISPRIGPATFLFVARPRRRS
jgi:SAM-dependent methyltransferase